MTVVEDEAEFDRNKQILESERAAIGFQESGFWQLED